MVSHAFILVKISTGEHQNWAKIIHDKITKLEGVKSVYLLFGQYDLIVELEAHNLKGLSRYVIDEIRGIKGVKSTETLIAIKPT
jgi:DNA-binding Lrp family transcriptional regulator